MQHFSISIHSKEEVQAFVNLAMVQPFDVLVGNEKQQVNGKSFMGMFTLDHHKPLHVSVRCSEEEFGRFREQTRQIFM